MGRFSEKFAQAAGMAAPIIEGTLYARYYGIDSEELLALGEADPGRRWSWAGTLASQGKEVDGPPQRSGSKHLLLHSARCARGVPGPRLAHQSRWPGTG